MDFHCCWSVSPSSFVAFIHYIGVDFTFGLLDCVHYNKDFVISRFVILSSRFYSIHFTVTLAGLKNILVAHYTRDFVI